MTCKSDDSEESVIAWINLSNPSQQRRQPAYRKRICSLVATVQHRKRCVLKNAGASGRGSMGRASRRKDILQTVVVNSQEKDLSSNLVPPNPEDPTQICVSSGSVDEAVVEESVLNASESHDHKEDQAVFTQPSLEGKTPFLPYQITSLHKIVGALGLSIDECIDRHTMMIEGVLDDSEADGAFAKVSGLSFVASLLRQSTTYLAVAVLLGAASLSDQKGLSLVSAAFLALRGLSLGCVQARLQHTGTALADDAVMSVFSLAWWEALYGTEDAHRIHSLALATIIRQKGDHLDPDHLFPAFFAKWLNRNTAPLIKP